MLTAQDCFVSPQIDSARTLPVSAFRDSSYFQKELDTVFRNSWCLLPKVHLQKPLPGQTSTLWDVLALRGNAVRFSFMGEDLLFKRGFEPKGEPALLAFPNRCPHAFYPFLLAQTDETRSRQIHCGQHGLCLDWSGSYISHPGFDPKTPCPELSLKPYPLHEWLNFLFINLGTPDQEIEEFMTTLLSPFADYPLQEMTYTPQEQECRVVPGNWKQHAWNYMDSLHIQWIHKRPDGLFDAVHMNSYQTELYPSMSLQWAYAKNDEDGMPQEWLHPRFRDPSNPARRVFALWWMVLPNVTLNFYPWGLSVNIYEPRTPTETTFHWHHYVVDKEKYKNRNTRWLNKVVDDEDVQAMAQVEKILKSHTPGHQRGVFAPLSEQGPHWFHRRIFEKTFEAALI